MNAYVDSSVILRRVLGEHGALKQWNFDQSVASALLTVECFRAIDRLQFSHRVSEELIAAYYQTIHELVAAVTLVDVTAAILRRAAESFPVSLKTLDAIHLSTAVQWRDSEDPSLIFVTHDRAVGVAARAMGFSVLGL